MSAGCPCRCLLEQCGLWSATRSTATRLVEDLVGQTADAVHGGAQILGCRGEHGDRFADLAPDGSHADAEPGRKTREGVAVAQVRQGEQGLPAGVEKRPALPATAADSHNGVNLELHQSLWIDETRYFHEGARRSHLRETLAMGTRRLSPTSNVNKHDPGSDDVCQRRTGLSQRLLGDVQATHGLRVHISRTGCGPVVRDRRGAGHGDVRPYPHGA